MTIARDLMLAPELKRLKRATGALLEAVGTQQDAADVISRRLPRNGDQRHLSNAKLNHTDVFLRIDEVLALEEDARGSAEWPQVTRALARHHGCMLVRVPEQPCAADWHREIGRLSAQVGQVIQRLCEALSDLKVDAGELERGAIRERIAEAMEVLAGLDALCAAVEREGAAPCEKGAA